MNHDTGSLFRLIAGFALLLFGYALILSCLAPVWTDHVLVDALVVVAAALFLTIVTLESLRGFKRRADFLAGESVSPNLQTARLTLELNNLTLHQIQGLLQTLSPSQSWEVSIA